jgi:hypothetical protein
MRLQVSADGPMSPVRRLFVDADADFDAPAAAARSMERAPPGRMTRIPGTRMEIRGDDQSPRGSMHLSRVVILRPFTP